MKKGDKVAIVNCSNGRPGAFCKDLERLLEILTEIGLEPILGEYIFEKDSVFSGTGQERAESLMQFYRDEEIKAIFDISGGDLANEILPYLDYQVIAESRKRFWGYSDLTCVINAIYAKTGCSSVLHQVRNLLFDEAGERIKQFAKTVFEEDKGLFDIDYAFVQQEEMRGIFEPVEADGGLCTD